LKPEFDKSLNVSIRLYASYKLPRFIFLPNSNCNHGCWWHQKWLEWCAADDIFSKLCIRCGP